jgi:branched-chain amino acid transport system permease protein
MRGLRGLALPLLLLALLAAAPFAGFGAGHALGLLARGMILGIAALGLWLLVGGAGLVSFGHAAMLGIGAYAVVVLDAAGITEAAVVVPAAIGAAALFALLTGAVAIGTSGVHFIMITLAFAQMMFYLVNSMKAYGGDEGLTLPSRASIGLGLDLGNELVFYYVVLLFLAAVLYGLHRLVHARFGRVVIAIRENEARAEAIGLPVYRYKLACFVIAGAVGGLAGALLASHGKYVTPNVLHWLQSGTLMIMVILGGVGRLWGGVIGAFVLLGLEHLIADYPIGWLARLAPNYQQHAGLGVGLVLLAIVLFAPQGIAGLVARKRNA